MGGFIQMFRGRIGFAIIGVLLVGGVAAVAGVGSVWRPTESTVGAVVQGAPTATNVAIAAQPTATATSEPTATAQAIPTDTPAPVPTATPITTIRGTVVSTDPGTQRFAMTRNGTSYTILVNQATIYSGIATQLSDIQPNDRVTVTIAAWNDATTIVAQKVAVSLPDN